MTIAVVTRDDPYIDALRAEQLFADASYQRDLDQPRVERMISEFDRTLLGVLEVSARVEGRYAVIDGQHRWAAAQGHSGGGQHLVCQIHTGLSVEDEARLFYEIDRQRRNLTWWDRWRARRGAGDRQVLAIDAVLARHHLQVHPSAADGNIRATKALETIVEDLGDRSLLDSALVVLTAAFGRSFDGFDGALMHGVALVLAHYDADELDLNRLVTQLRAIAPRQLRARAAASREAHRGTLPRLCAAVIVERYNTGRGRNLEPFFSRVPSTSKAGAAFNHARKERGAIRRWAERNGHDLAGSRSIPPTVRRAYEEAQVAETPPATSATQTTETTAEDDAADPGVRHELDGEESPLVGVPDSSGVRRALANGRGIKWVMDAYGLDYRTAKAIADRTTATPAA